MRDLRNGFFIGLAIGLVAVATLGAVSMTDRRIDRTVSSHLAALEARVRELETVVGGGIQQGIQAQELSAAIVKTGGTPGEPDSGAANGGPEVSVQIGPQLRAIVLATAGADTDEQEPDSARIFLTMTSPSGAAITPLSQVLSEYLFQGLPVAGGSPDARLSLVGMKVLDELTADNGGSTVFAEGPGEYTFRVLYGSNFGVATFFSRAILVIPF